MKYKVNAGSEFDIKKANVVQFRRCELFNETLKKHRNCAAKLEEFIKTKTQDPLGRFGSKDQHFVAGDLSQTGIIHARLTGDISILYKRSGRDPITIDLVAIATHDELGTGQPANLKQQKKMAKLMTSQTFESKKVISFRRL